MEATQMTQNTRWLLVIGIVLGAIGVVVLGSAIGGVVADDPVQDRTGFDQPHADGDHHGDSTAQTDAHDDHYHGDGDQTFDHHHDEEWEHRHDDTLETHPHADDDEIRGPQRTGAERHIHGGPCH